MNKEQLAFVLHAEVFSTLISVEDLSNPTEGRTLAYGYTPERYTHHVYLYRGEIHVHVYEGTVASQDVRTLFHQARADWDAESLVTKKRVYPQYSDMEFALLMKQKGCELPFTNWLEPRRKVIDFAGAIWEEN